MKSGAAALVVIQTMEIWPFMMGDSTNELPSDLLSSHDGGLPIPVVMISKKDSELLLKMLSPVKSPKSSSNSANNHNIQAAIHFGNPVKDCSICQEAFCEHVEVLKLPCRHLYHSDCVIQWLNKVQS